MIFATVRFAVALFKKQLPLRAHWFPGMILLALLLALRATGAESADDQYIRVVSIVDQADTLGTKGQADSAKTKYQEARNILLELKKNDPTWNPKMVSFRLNYVTEKITALSQPGSTPAQPVAVAEKLGEKPKAKLAVLPANLKIKLLDAGAEPRRELRFHSKTGDKQEATVTTKATMGMGNDEAAIQAVKMPGLTVTLSVVTKKVSATGDINYEARVENMGVLEEPGTAPEMVEAMKTSIRGVKGLVIVCTMANQGFSRKTQVMIPPGVDTEVRASMEAMKENFEDEELVLPHEAVGVGARWEVKQKITSEGMLIDQTTTHELVSMEGDIITTKATMVQQAANQKIPNPMVPGTSANLIKLVGSGKTSMTSDLGKLLPTQTVTEDQTRTTFSIEIAGEKQTMTMKTDTISRLESK
jgi:hypothetical protein